MKLMTLNTHSLEETDYESKLHTFAEVLCREQPDIIALQEVNQTRSADPADPRELVQCGYVPCADSAFADAACADSACADATCADAACADSACADSVSPSAAAPSPVIRCDNHAYRVARLCAQMGLNYHWTWTGAKIGYDKYDEGLAIFSRFPILGTEQFYITGTQDYTNWKTRRILGISISADHGMEHFYSVHMGWWNDAEEPFQAQWERICRTLPSRTAGPVWLMGDFNSPAHVQGQGRDLIRNSGWLDSYELAASKDSGITAGQVIDGWRENHIIGNGGSPGMRIDYIWTSRQIPVRSSRVIFNGSREPVVSDHYGIIVEY